jgi:hypothetical protein
MAYTTILTSTTVCVLLLALASNISVASAAPSPNVFTDIQCYALPYGAMGIISHLLTYWTIAWVGWGKVPLWPAKDIRQYQLDFFLAIATLCTCIPSASITIVRCRLSWHFVLISIWKLVTSVSVALISIHRCIITRREQKRPKVAVNGTTYHLVDYESYQDNQASHSNEGPITQFSNKNPTKNQDKANLTPFFWLLLFLAGTIVGMVGLGALLWDNFRHDKTIRHLTYGFAAPMVIIPGLVAAYWYTEHCCGSTNGRRGMQKAYRHTFRGALAAFVAVFGFFSALYGDLVLGIIAGNILGVPTGDITPLYWIWFVAKRFPLLSL